MQRALVSVSDKSKLEILLEGLLCCYPELEILSTGGTAKHIQSLGYSVTLIEEYTGFPECFSGCVKSLHPKILGGILFDRESHAEEADSLAIKPIDLVVCNLYPFTDYVNNNADLPELLAQIDIGGATMIMSAVKNHRYVAVLVNPDDYASFAAEIQKTPELSSEFRASLATKAVNYIADYRSDNAVELQQRLTGQMNRRLHLTNGSPLRYGENPQQQAQVFAMEPGIATAQILNGKPMSYINYEDCSAGYEAVQDILPYDFSHAASVIKHSSLCGYAAGKDAQKTFEAAWNSDPKSAFGGVVACSFAIDDDFIALLKGKFIEAIIAPAFSENFLSWVRSKKPDLRLLQVAYDKPRRQHLKEISGGFICQDYDFGIGDYRSWFQPTRPESNPRVGIVTSHPIYCDKSLYIFAVLAVKHIKSNAIAIVHNNNGIAQLIGIGGGQQSRIDAVNLAIGKAKANGHLLNRGILASDAFFPFDDCVRTANQEGIQHFIHPGGSKNDELSEKACQQLQCSMIYNGRRFFKH